MKRNGKLHPGDQRGYRVCFLFAAVTVICLFWGCHSSFTKSTPESLESYRREFPSNMLARLQSCKKLSLVDAQKIVLENNPDYISAYYAVRAAKFRYYRALSAYFPQISAQFNVSQEISAGTDLRNPPERVFTALNGFGTAVSLRATLLLFDGLEREFHAIAMRESFHKSIAEDENVRRLLIRAAAYAYFDIMLATEEIRIYEADMAFQESCVIQARDRYRFGLISKGDLLNFMILKNEAEALKLDAEYRRDIACYALIELMGGSIEQFPKHITFESLPITAEEPFFSFEAAVNEAVRNRPDLRAARLSLEISTWQRRSAISRFFPVIQGYAGLGNQYNREQIRGDTFSLSHYNQVNFSYGISGTWQIFTGFDRYNYLREASALEKHALFTLEKAFVGVVNEVHASYVNCQILRQRVELYRDIMQWVYEQRQLVAAEYWAGKETITRLNGAQSTLVDATSQFTILLIEFHKAQAQFQAAIGSNAPLTLPHHKIPDTHVVFLSSLLDLLENNYPASPVPAQ